MWRRKKEPKGGSLRGLYPIYSGPVTDPFAGMYRTPKWASQWYADALREARRECADGGERLDALRREIVFAVAAVENRFVEWFVEVDLRLRDVGIMRATDELFREAEHIWDRGFLRRFWEIIDFLVRTPNTRLTGREIDHNNKAWSDLTEVLKLRNGLLHGAASAPKSLSFWGTLSRKFRPPWARKPDSIRRFLPLARLAQVEQGWATRRAAALLRCLDAWAGIESPSWLVDP